MVIDVSITFDTAGPGRCQGERFFFYMASRTSIASRSPSPRKLNAITVIMMASPGTVVRWGATNRKCLPSLIIAPQEGVGGATPRPRKLNPASATIARAIPRRIPGKAKRMSASRMKRWSTFPAKNPAADPTRSPIARDRETVPSPTATETRAPWMRRLSRSRPSLSGRSQWDREGPDSPESSAWAPGSNGASNGASTAASSSRTTTANPAPAPRWRGTRLAMVCLTVRSLIPDPRVEAGVQKIRQEVHGHRAESDEQDASLDQRVIPGVDRLDGEAAGPGPGEDRLGDDAAGKQRADLQAHHREDGDEGVRQRA